MAATIKLMDYVSETENRVERYLIIDKFRYFLHEGKENHWYVKDFETWAASMLINAVWKPDEICEIFYKKEGCNDSHVMALGRLVLREMELI